jgi:hypothetical protein
MGTDQSQETAKVHHFDAIEPKLIDCHSSDRRLGQNESKVFAPGKMVIPILLAWMKE